MSPLFGSSCDDSIADSIEHTENDASNASATDNHGSTDSMPRSSLQTPMALARLSGANPQVPNIQPHQHSTLFYLSLIEGRCRTQAASALNAGRRPEEHFPEHHHEVHSLAQHLFSEMSKELRKAGVLPNEFAGPELSELRGNYLSSFDSILHNIAAKRSHKYNNTYSSIFESSNVLEIDRDLSSTPFTTAQAFALQKYTMATSAGDTIPKFPLLSLRDTVYKTGYKEICLLGKGGFGKVYKVFHNLDSCHYAIKKVVIGADSLSGKTAQSMAEECLSELRTLARLNHRNIVRYHHSWAEKRPSKGPGDSSSGSDSGEELDAPEPDLHKDKNLKDGGKFTKNQLNKESRQVRKASWLGNESQDGIVFGLSTSSTKPAGALSKPPVGVEKKSFFRSGNSSSSDSDNSIDNDESIEEITRATGVRRNSDVKYDVVLFIQMSIHPMNLDEFLWPEQQKQGDVPQIQHCYHSLPTVRILLRILDGVEYIHRNKIVHRDLKPSNIMLSISNNATSLLDGSIKVSDCPECNDDGSKELYVTPHIGDFGLVADIQDPENPTLDTAITVIAPDAINKSVQPATFSGLSSRQPGTRFYCAPKALKGKAVICPKVDVYSLGVIALEMIYRFGTRSERAFELDKLKDGIFPLSFENHVMAEGIKRMMCMDRLERWNCTEVRTWLEAFEKQAEMPREVKKGKETSKAEVGGDA